MMPKRTRQERGRLVFLCAVIALFFVVIVARLAHLQLGLGETYRAKVVKQSSARVDIPALRGNIYDRTGTVVVQTVKGQALCFYARTPSVRDSAAAYLESFYKLPRGTATKKFKLDTARFAYIDRRLSDAHADKVRRDEPPGLFLREGQIRNYPYGLVGKQVTGFTDIDNRGQEGIEKMYDSLLSGTQGWADLLRDGHNDTLRYAEKALVAPVPGTGLMLTLDWRMQEIVEEELRKAVAAYGAKAAQGVFVDVSTGELLAVAHYDPEEKHPEKPLRLKPVADVFEPGSVFKIVSAAGIMDAGLIDGDERIYCEMGKWQLSPKPLKDDKKHGALTFREIVERSSNIGIGKKAVAFGGKRLYEHAQSFGFGKKTGLGFRFEQSGAIARPERWTDRQVAVLSIGHAISVTPLQMCMAIAAVANGGELISPRLLRGYVSPDGLVSPAPAPATIKRVVCAETTDSLRSYLRGVVEVGTAKDSANSTFISIAGKTGTAEVPNKGARGYKEGAYNASFGGFFPAEKPRVAGIVIVEEPSSIEYGGHTAAPTFRRIAERIAVLEPDRYVVSQQSLARSTEDHRLSVPDFSGRRIQYAKSVAKAMALHVSSTDSSGIIDWQFPVPGTRALEGAALLVADQSSTDHTRLPDFAGCTIKEVASFCSHIGVPFTIKGTGRIVSHMPPAGSAISGHDTLRFFTKLDTVLSAEVVE